MSGADGFRVGTRSPMIAGGNSIPEMVAAEHPSIWKQSGNFGPPRVHLPKLNPKYPETKHTVKCAAPRRARARRPSFRE